MDLHLGYLAVFVGYLVVVLIVGVWGLKRETYGAYAVADRALGLPLSVGSFFATYISSATVIGFVGFTTLNGAAIFPTYFWGFALGWITLTFAAARMRSMRLRSVPSLFEVRYGSGSLRALSAVIIVVAFAFSVMTQLVAGSLILRTIVGIPQITGLLLLGVVLTAYTVLGGLVSVVRTDFLQGGLILIAVLAAFGLVSWRLGGDLFVPRPDQTPVLQGPVTSWVDVLAFMLVAWGGVAAQPYYLHRFFATRDTATARQMVGFGAVLASALYLMVLFIGMGLPKLLPGSALGDNAILRFGLDAGGLLGSALLIGVICAVQSTVDSALHLAGVYTAEDIIARARPRMGDAARLRTARSVTALLGVLCISGAAYFIVSGGEFIVTLLDIWLGTLSSALLLPMYASLFWRRATGAGAMAGSAGGFLGYFVPLSLDEYAGITIPGHPIFYGFGISLVLLTGVSLITRANPTVSGDEEPGSHSREVVGT